MAQLGKYQLVRKLATGGMAEVFLAKAAGPMGFEKTLVLKRILPHLSEDPTFVEMFLGEAKLAADLNHPHIVQIFDFGQAEGSYFIAMEYIDGPNLRALGKRSSELGFKMPFNLAAKIISFACEGLAYAHDFTNPETGEPLELIHRDISPDNILLSRQGAVKVVDFGIAKAAGRAGHTKTGTLKGKLAYMPPEQLHSQPLDRRADVFALAMVMYELITGMRPFDATSEVSILQAILYEPLISASARRPDVPPALQAILDRGLAKEREARYPDCRAFQVDLERFIASTGEPVGPFQLASLVRELAAPAVGNVTTPGQGSQPGRVSGTGRAPSGVRAPVSGVAPLTQMTHPARPTALPVDLDSVGLSVPRSRAPLVGLVALGALALGAISFFALRGEGRAADPAPLATSPDPRPAPVPPVEPATPVDVKPAEVKPAEVKPVDIQTAEVKPVEAKTERKVPVRPARGSHTLVAAREPEQPRDAPGNASFDLDVTPPAQVRVNGKVTCSGVARCKVRNVKSGEVQVELSDGHLGFSKQQTFTLHAGDNGLMQLSVAQGAVEFRIRPYATVSLDGRLLGETPFTAVQAYEGHHRVQMLNKDLNKDVTVDFTVRPGQTNIFKYNLEE